MFRTPATLAALIGASFWFFVLSTPANAADDGVKITRLDDRLRIEINGDLFTEYRFTGAPHVYYYPVHGPGGRAMTRNYPMKEGVANEASDHPHHRSF